ncbi:MAG TPA: hypothetical protein VGG07_20355 [Solirubrobacteraceae bacterium]|jgi:hypothetical protein
MTPYFEYTAEEVQTWIDLRGLATHADQRNVFALERDFQHMIGRMEQAAYDVLMNKKNWRSTDTARREVWFPPAGTIGADEVGYIVKASTPKMTSLIMDQWGDYPLDLKRWTTSDDWWPKTELQYGAPLGQVDVVHPPAGLAVWDAEDEDTNDPGSRDSALEHGPDSH